MGSFDDLVGSRFERLVVLRREFNGKVKVYWLCQCDCGNVTVASGQDLRAGDKKSCGCLRKDLLRVDLLGKRFGKLIVIDRAPKKGKSSSQFWLCRCDCGNEHVASAQHLTDNQVKSCGCWFYKDEEVLLEEAKKRFFSKVEKTETCWIWKGSKIRGYGVLFYKQQIRAHRFSYMIHHGPLDKTKVICHKCDNPECVNPDHLYQGTTQENSRDASERNRIRTGSRHHKAKITEEDLKIILDRKYKGVDLAKIYGLSENHISFIRQGKSWKHVKTP